MTLNTCSRHVLRALQPPAAPFTVPLFLLPTCHNRPFSTTPSRPSKIGETPLSVPPEVQFAIDTPLPSDATGRSQPAPWRMPKTVSIKGPLGELEMKIMPYLGLDMSNPARPVVHIEPRLKKLKKNRAMWGMTRAYLQNHILGVSEGHTAILSLVGVGYRATVERSAQTKQPEYEGQEFVSLKVGYSHPIELGVPESVKASTPQPTRILLEGCDKEVVMQFAAKIRAWRKPEPYKGKGIFINGETIRLKNKKIK